MYEQCDHCSLRYQREPGFFLGAIYFNYGLTAICSVSAYALLVFGGGVTPNRGLLITLAFVVVFPLWFFRYARSLWLGFDQLFDPSDDGAPDTSQKEGIGG